MIVVVMSHFLHENFIFMTKAIDLKLRDVTNKDRNKTNPSYSSSLHSFITDRAWPLLSVTGERGTEERRKQMERYWDKNRMFMYVCGHMYPSVFSLNAKKSGTMDMTPSAKRRGWRKKRLEMMSQRSQRTKEWKHNRRRDITEKKKKLKWGDKTSRRDKRKGGKRKGTGCLPVRTDVISPASCIRLPSDQRLPLTLTFGPLEHRFHLELSPLTLLVWHFILAQRLGLIHFQ